MQHDRTMKVPHTHNQFPSFGFEFLNAPNTLVSPQVFDIIASIISFLV